MLNFLEERSDFKPRNSFKFKPQIAFGVSIDAPSTFRNEHSMVSPLTHRNPFFDASLEGGKQVPSSKNSAKNELNYLHKTDINQIQETKVIGSGELTSRPDRYHYEYQQELQKNSSRFKLNRGQFTNFIQKVRVTNQVFGPMSGEERSAEKSLQTKRSIINKSHLHLEKSKEKLQLQVQSRERSLRKEGSRLLQKIIDQRRVLREKRDKFYVSYKKELTERKSPRHDYTLPRILGNRDAKIQIKTSGKHQDFGIFKTIDNSMLSSYIK